MAQRSHRVFGFRKFFQEGKHGTENRRVGQFGRLANLFSESKLKLYLPYFQSYRRNYFKTALIYLKGLISLDRRRNMERMSELAKTNRQALHQRLQHFISNIEWDVEGANDLVWKDADSLLGGHAFTGLFIDPSAFPKRGNDSVGVARQWCGIKGKVDNCQVAVMACVGLGQDTCLTGRRLYLPKSWLENLERLRQAGVPEHAQVYKSHADLALELIEEADRNQVRYRWIGVDSEFGKLPWFLRTLNDQGKIFVAEVACDQMIYLANPTMTEEADQEGLTVKYHPRPISVEAFVKQRGLGYFKEYKVGERTKPSKAKILHERVWLWDGEEEQAHQWHLIIRLRKTAKGNAFRYALSNAEPATPPKHLALMQSQRYLVEHAIRDQKQEIGLGDYQVRGWNAWHKHATMCFIAGLKFLQAKIKNLEMGHLTFRDIKAGLILSFTGASVEEISDYEALLYERHVKHEKVKVSKLKTKIRKSRDPGPLW